MAEFSKITSRALAILVDDIDTDQIIPARFLKTTTKAGLGNFLFADWRYDDNDEPIEDFILNDPKQKEVRILVAGDNFGCGSSREHAPWALTDYGFKAVISTSFADIFKNNALKNGLLPIQVTKETHEKLVEIIEEAPFAEISIDLKERSLLLPDGEKILFPIDSFSQKCLIKGMDQLDYLMSFMERIEAFEK
ncbi:MAG: 3-isopropylmalate dehydratase small subunit [Anaerolineaceae bacterium]|nr:3-isopropylmalate dehydratase small subunit [Anaerolineaceae bacterium]